MPECMLEEQFTMGANGKRHRKGVLDGVRGLTKLVRGVSGTGGVGKENIAGNVFSGVSRASGDELEELLEEWDKEVDFEEELLGGV